MVLIMDTDFPQPHKTHQKLQRDVDVILKDVMHLWADLSEQQSEQETSDSAHINVDLVLDQGYHIKTSSQKKDRTFNSAQKMYRATGSVERVHLVERISVSNLIYNPRKTRKTKNSIVRGVLDRTIRILRF